MSHLVLARKYRPKRLSEVLGQESIVLTLNNAIKKNRLAHALLFTGSRGVGKTTVARIVAKSLVCSSLIDNEPCLTCHECISIDNFSSLDVIEIDGASHTGVDDVRELRESARYRPSSAKYKIFIIDEVHMLSISAFNALLKILEEPPEHVRFMLATTEVHKIPKTILSRCQRYDFKRVPDQIIQNTVKDLTIKEGYDFDNESLRIISKLADGSLRDALSLAEQALSQNSKIISGDKLAHLFGLVSKDAINTLSKDILNKEVSGPLNTLKESYENGFDLCHLMDALTERFRILSMCAHLNSFEEANNIINAIEKEDFLLAKNYDAADLKRLFAMSLDLSKDVFQSRFPLYAMELMVLKMALRPGLKDAVSISYAINKLENLLQNRPMPKENSVKNNLMNNFKEEIKKEDMLKPDNNPIIKKAIEIFGAEITDSRPLKMHEVI